VTALKAGISAAGNELKDAALAKAKESLSGKGIKVARAARPPKSGFPNEASLAVQEARIAREEQRKAITQPVNETFVKIPQRPLYMGATSAGKAKTRKQARDLDEIAVVGEGLCRAGGCGLYSQKYIVIALSVLPTRSMRQMTHQGSGGGADVTCQERLHGGLHVAHRGVAATQVQSSNVAYSRAREKVPHIAIVAFFVPFLRCQGRGITAYGN